MLLRKSPKVIEFAGLPGAGKSTVLNAVLPLLEQADIKVVRDSSIKRQLFGEVGGVSKRLAVISSMLMEPSLFYRAIRFWLESGAPWDWQSFYRLVVLLYRRKVLVTATKRKLGDLLIFDECLAQGLWGMMVHRNPGPNQDVKGLLGRLIKGLEIRVVFFEASPKLVVGRLKERASQESRFDNLPTTELFDVLTRHELHLREIISCMRDGLGVPVLVVSGNDPVARNSHRIAEWILQHDNWFV